MYNFYTCPDTKIPDLCEHNLLFNALPVLIKTKHQRRVSSVLWHDYLQIWYTISGTYRHVLQGVSYQQSPGSLILVFPYMTHQYDTSQSDLEELSVFQISIRKDVFQKYGIPFLSHGYNAASFNSYCLQPSITILEADRPELNGICTELLKEYNKKLDMQANRLMTMISSFLEVCTWYSHRKVSAREQATIHTRNAGIERAMTFLKENRTQSITIDEISSAAIMSRRSFTDGFKAVTGQTTYSYLNALRIKDAVRMLRKTKKSISQIAKECGFCSSSYFCQKCIETYGLSPHALRRSLSQWSRENNESFMHTVSDMRWTQVFDEASMQRNRCSMSFY